MSYVIGHTSFSLNSLLKTIIKEDLEGQVVQ